MAIATKINLPIEAMEEFRRNVAHRHPGSTHPELMGALVHGLVDGDYEERYAATAAASDLGADRSNVTVDVDPATWEIFKDRYTVGSALALRVLEFNETCAGERARKAALAEAEEAEAAKTLLEEEAERARQLQLAKDEAEKAKAEAKAASAAAEKAEEEENRADSERRTALAEAETARAREEAAAADLAAERHLAESSELKEARERDERLVADLTERKKRLFSDLSSGRWTLDERKREKVAAAEKSAAGAWRWAFGATMLAGLAGIFAYAIWWISA